MKQCSKCKEWKDESDFHKRNNRKSGLYSSCKTCKNKITNEHEHTHKRIRDRRGESHAQLQVDPEYNKRYWSTHKVEMKNNLLKRTYGITIEEYNIMFENQNGCCAICGIHQSKIKRSLHIDHDHKTGKIRGLLCFRCNPLLGYAHDDTGILQKAINYLTKG